MTFKNMCKSSLCITTDTKINIMEKKMVLIILKNDTLLRTRHDLILELPWDALK